MKYCLPTTKLHPLSIRYPQYLVNINTIIHEAGGAHRPFHAQVALELDKIKDSSEDRDIKLGHKTMDMVLGMKDGAVSLTLLVEFKLDCKNAINLSESDLRGKIKGSKILLFGSGIPVSNKYVFIFNDTLLAVSRRIISSRLLNANCEVLSVDELKATYF